MTSKLVAILSLVTAVYLFFAALQVALDTYTLTKEQTVLLLAGLGLINLVQGLTELRK